MNEIDCTGDETETCTCPGCVKFHADFDKWVADLGKRWGKTPAVHICDGDCGPLALCCGDVRDHSAVR